MEVIDNFLDDFYFQDLVSILESRYMPWYLDNVLYDEDTELTGEDKLYNYQFGHMLWDENKPFSNNYHYFSHILEKLPDMDSLIRMKLNLGLKTDRIIKHGHHVDQPYEGKTAVLYFNTCNGYTEFESTGERVYSRANRVVIFDMQERHTGTTCTNDSKRLVLNINWTTS